MTSGREQIRSYWDIDSATYDQSRSHKPRTALELAVWGATLSRLLPPRPARVLDVGAGTGFLSVLLARQGYEVTALDLSPGMLEHLRENASISGVEITTIEGDAADPPSGDFDAVVERHVLWTLPDPRAAVEAWRKVAPAGRLVLLESLWGSAAGAGEQLRSAGHLALRRMRGESSDHHAEYEPALRSELPLGSGTTPDQLATLVESSSWGVARIERLRDVEWATRRALPSAADRLLGVAPRFAVIAG
ncbi:MAG: class I SAM-dependent methyltransferase [Acidimicrobiales bacterium]